MTKTTAVTKTATQSKSISKTPSKIVAESKTPDDDDDFGAYAGSGMETVTAQDVIIPRLAILQALSPQVLKNKPEYIKGSEPGQVCNTGTNELFPDGIIFLPVIFRKQWLEWAPRNTNKSLVKVWDTDERLESCTYNDKGQPITPEGNLVQETMQFFGFNMSSKQYDRCFLPMASSQLKRGKKLLTFAQNEKLSRGNGQTYTAPLWYRTYNMGVGEESNAEGDWFGWTVERGQLIKTLCEELDIDWPNFRASVIAFVDSFDRGEVRGDISNLDQGAHGSSTDDEAM